MAKSGKISIPVFVKMCLDFTYEILPLSQKKLPCILHTTYHPDTKILQDLYTIFLIALDVFYENLEDGLEASTLIGTAARNVKGVETEIWKKRL